MSMMLIIQFLVLTAVVSGVIIFVLKKILYDSTQGAVNRLNKETEDVRAKQAELNEKIKQANEELDKRRKEADALVAKMTENAQEKAKEEREKLGNKARQEGEEIIAKAQATKDAMRKAVEKELEIKLVDFSTEVLSVVLSQKAKAVFHEALIEEFMNELEKIDATVITQDVHEAEIITAAPIDKKNKERLSAVLKAKMKREINIKASEDPKLVSGALIKFGSLALDGSLRNFIKEAGTVIKEKVEKS